MINRRHEILKSFIKSNSFIFDVCAALPLDVIFVIISLKVHPNFKIHLRNAYVSRLLHMARIHRFIDYFEAVNDLYQTIKSDNADSKYVISEIIIGEISSTLEDDSDL